MEVGTKSKSPARECVTTHLTNAVASKMDDAQVEARQHASAECDGSQFISRAYGLSEKKRCTIHGKRLSREVS